ncbi:MAG: hypothetical protein U0903_16700 [Planctomycetales bacterium]
MKNLSVCLAALVGLAALPVSAPAAEIKTAACFPWGCSSPCGSRPYSPCNGGSCAGPVYSSPVYGSPVYTSPSYYTVPSYGGNYGGMYGNYQPNGGYQPSYGNYLGYGGSYSAPQGPTTYPSYQSGPPALGPAMGPSNFPGSQSGPMYPPSYGPYNQPGYAPSQPGYVPFSSRTNTNLTSQANPSSPFYP